MLILLLFTTLRVGFALPVPQNGNDPSQCNSEDTRTVVGIIWSCITTIFACTWVAVHPNVPDRSDPDWMIMLRRAQILVVALIAPEYIILWAAHQLMSARNSLKELRRYPCCKDWTLTHGFFLVMGGFMLTDSSGKETKVLREEDLLDILSKGDMTIPCISSSEIEDKSKGDALTKTLVLIQTSWFMAQVISRAILHLPITELELTTVAFATLNVLTYIFWWRKPLNVKHHIPIPGENRRFLGSCRGPTPHPAVRSELAFSDSSSTSSCAFVSDPMVNSLEEREADARSKNEMLAFIRSQFVMLLRSSGPFLVPVRRNRDDGPQTQTFYRGSTSGTTRVRTLYSRASGIQMLIGALFGGIHCMAWTFFFPSKPEQILWRVTSLYITVTPLVLWVILVLALYAPAYFASVPVGVMVKIVFWLYIIARITILVLSFELLRHLPSGALNEVHWTTYIPHI